MKGAVGLEQSACELGQHEIGLGTRNTQVQCQGEFEPEADCRSVNGSHRRLAGQREFASDVLQLIDGLLQVCRIEFALWHVR